MERKYIKLNDSYSHLSLGNIIITIKELSKNKSSAIQSEVFCTIFNVPYANDSTINNYCIGSRSIGNDYKQIYINLKNKYEKNNKIFIDIVCNILTIVNGRIYDIKNIEEINKNSILKEICIKLYNISKNDLYIKKEALEKFTDLFNKENYYDLFVNFLIYGILEKKQPLYEDERIKNVVETLLESTKIGVKDLEDFLLLELNEGTNFDYSLVNLAKEGNAYANYHLGINEYRGYFSGKPNYEKAFEYFASAAEKNHPSAWWTMGNMIKNGKIGNYEYDEAIKYFEKAKSLGNIAAINSLGLMYKEGLGVKKDINIALSLFEEAASKNYVYAFNNLANYYKNKDINKTIEYFKKSAELKESYACKELGIIYLKNNSLKEAFKYFNESLSSSIKERNITSYYYLAKYFFSTGCVYVNLEKDINKAIDYYEKSSNLIDSLCELLYIYYEKKDLNKINYYKEKIENHKDYNKEYKNKIENILKNIKEKETINIP